MPDITINHAIAYTNLFIISQVKLQNALAALENLDTQNIKRAHQEGSIRYFVKQF